MTLQQQFTARRRRVLSRARRVATVVARWVAARFDLPTNLAIVGVVSGTLAGWSVAPALGLAILSVLCLIGATRIQVARVQRRRGDR